MPKCAVAFGDASVSTLTNCTCGRMRAASAKAGAIILHGPHHSAEKSATTGSSVPLANFGERLAANRVRFPGQQRLVTSPHFGRRPDPCSGTRLLARQWGHAICTEHFVNPFGTADGDRRTPRARSPKVLGPRHGRPVAFGTSCLSICDDQAIMTSVMAARLARRRRHVEPNRRDPSRSAADTAKSVLKPAIYDPPDCGTARRRVARVAARASPEVRRSARAIVTAAGASCPAAGPSDTPEPPKQALRRRQHPAQGRGDLRLRRAGHRRPRRSHGSQQGDGNCQARHAQGQRPVDIAEIHGDFVGELTVRTRLVIHGTGRVRAPSATASSSLPKAAKSPAM